MLQSVTSYHDAKGCAFLKEDHNAEKAFRGTTFGFEIKIMGKYFVCGKQPQISSVMQTRPV